MRRKRSAFVITLAAPLFWLSVMPDSYGQDREEGTLSEVLLAVFIAGIVVTWALAELVATRIVGAEPRHLAHR